ncbi:MAG: xanthine dehydrogenase family protein molybdopterin-binding subunit [Alphaproteobacteria bacterium]|nr:MAG: xanthine dehydrogenase family protein molybdopterin-binding subunit [Alphaproteobacteria bacterium]
MSAKNTVGSYVGQAIERQEDAALLGGQALFSDDLPIAAGTLHAAILRSPHAHAEIVSIDTIAAKALPSVAAVLIGSDIQQYSDPFITVLKRPIDEWSLAVDRVRFVGEAVAVVIAEDRYKAEDALDLINVIYKPLPAVINPKEAAKENAPILYPEAGSNVLSERHFKYGDPDGAFAKSKHKVSIEIDYPRNSQTPLEGYVVVASYNKFDDAYEVNANFQGPYTVHPVMSRALRVPGSRFRMQTPAHSGGGFGVKQAIFPYVVLMCLAARHVGRPVKWVEDRLEHLTAATAAPNRIIQAEAAVQEDGRVTAFRFVQLDDYGAHLRPPMPGPLYRQHGLMTGAYDVPNLAITNRLVLTNKTPSGMVRGFGGPQIYFAIERLMHRIAIELGMDPLDVIRRNLVASDSFPYRAAGGALLDSGDYQKAIDLGVNDGGLDELKRRREKARAEGKYYGIGYAAIVEPGQSNIGYLSTIVPFKERQKAGHKGGSVSHATIHVDPMGVVSVTADCIPQGQGQATVLSQIVADQLGLKPEDIKVSLEHDTQKDPWSLATGNYSSRFSSATAVAAHLAAKKVREKLIAVAGQALNVTTDDIELTGGKIVDSKNPENFLKFHRVAGLTHWEPGKLPTGMAAGLSETASWAPPELDPPTEGDQINTSLTYGFLFDYCGVEIDPHTAEIRIDKYVTTHDSGKLLNPLIANGQIYGAFAWGVGCALLEEFAYGEDGSFLTGTFADYLCPTSVEIPEPQILHMETPTPFTPLGAKGIGEGNCMSTPVCIANAVCDAIGAENVNLPIYPAKLLPFIDREETAPPQDIALSQRQQTPDGGRAIVGEGNIFAPTDPETVWQTLLDPRHLAAIIPGCQNLEVVGENAYRADVNIAVGPIGGMFRAEISLSDLDPPKSVTLSGSLAGPLGSSAGSGKVRLTQEENGTRIDYTYSVEVSGKVAAIGGRMLDGASQVLINQFFKRLIVRLGGEPIEKPTLWARFLRLLGFNR